MVTAVRALQHDQWRRQSFRARVRSTILSLICGQVSSLTPSSNWSSTALMLFQACLRLWSCSWAVPNCPGLSLSNTSAWGNSEKPSKFEGVSASSSGGTFTTPLSVVTVSLPDCWSEGAANTRKDRGFLALRFTRLLCLGVIFGDLKAHIAHTLGNPYLTGLVLVGHQPP